MEDQKYIYDMTIDDLSIEQENDSHTKILRMIKPGSSVLECGPANGVMTRYLKQKLGCSITIIEMDRSCYEQAMRFADRGICADLEQTEWIRQFDDESFDYILYADVLEHLRDPQRVLCEMKRLLKPNGAVLLSVPNVANGDIIMNLLCDQFNYTALGLLDNNHIHLFSRWSLREMIRNAGYFLAYEGYTRIPLFHTEQAAFIPNQMRMKLESALQDHPTRDIYQFVCKLTLKEVPLVSDVDAMTVLAPIVAQSRFYLDTGRGYNEQQRVDVTAEILEGGRNHYCLTLPGNCREVRFDPIEDHACLLQQTVIKVDGHVLEGTPLNGVRVGNVDFFPDQDPQFIITLPPEAKELDIETAITPLGTGSWLEISDVVDLILAQVRELLEYKEKQLQAVNNAKEQVEEILSMTQKAMDVKEGQLQAVNGAKEQVEADLRTTRKALDIKEGQLQAVNEAKEQAEEDLRTTREALDIKEGQLQAVNGAKERVEADLRTTREALDIKEGQLQAVNGAKERAEADLRTTRKALEIKEGQLQELNDAKERVEAELAEVKSDADRTLALYDQEKEHRVEVENRLEQIQKSASWKITKPLRWICGQNK